MMFEQNLYTSQQIRSYGKLKQLVISLLVLSPLALITNTALAFEDQWVNVTLASRFDDANSTHSQLISPSYLDNDFEHLWLTESGQPSEAAQDLIQLVTTFTELADQHPWLAPYNEFLQRAQKNMDLPLPRYLLATDLLYSDIFAQLQQDITSERFLLADQDGDHQEYKYGVPDYKPRLIDPDTWQLGFQEQLKAAADLPQNQRSNYLRQQIQELYPDNPQTQPLLNALSYWREQQQTPWPQLPPGKKLSTGSIRPDWVPVLILQLQKLNLLDQDYAPELADRYDAQLVTAVKKLQAQHGQKVDGIIGPNTRRVLNLTPDYRVRQLAHNFRRLYHLPKNLGERYVMINMADYQLKLVKNKQTALEMKVIIGTPKTRTPIMTQKLTSVILSPRWNIPKGIGAKYIFPKAKQNPSYLTKREILVVNGWSQPAREVPINQINFNAYANPENFPYRFVQLPGNYNQLGYVKFRLSNNKAIYMHDTPGKHLFDRNERALSNGCVRIENALLLADHLLTDNWTSNKIQGVIRSKRETFLKASTANLPVYMMYWTVWQDKEGQLQWRDDIYSKDQLPVIEGMEIEGTGSTMLATASQLESEG